MLTGILTADQHALLRAERDLLADVEGALRNSEASEQDLHTLRTSILQLDELFLLVVVGEFNSGKSAFINALLGQQVLAEGVTPTTSKIHLVQHGDTVDRRSVDAVTEITTAPVDLLREVTIVDTPGTNALDREHEAITTRFVPRADLVLFVTSSDRPFSESERAFLDSIRSWGKNVLVIVNKVDILRDEQELVEIEAYIRDNCRRLLGVEPPIYPVSSLLAADARSRGDQDALETSRLPRVEQALRSSLDRAERLRLKLLNPLGVASTLLEQRLSAGEARRELLADDIQTIEDIERQLGAYGEDVEREFKFRLADIDNTLLALEKRGVAFFDDTLRLTRVTRLFDRERLRTEFESEVVGDAPQQIEAKVEAIIDWLVESDLNQWQAVVQHVNRRRSHHQERVVGEVGGRFEYDRSRLLETVGKAARDGLDSYDRATEARRMAEDVQKAVASTALVEAGAVGLGATVAVLASGTAADATGLIAAGLLAALGLFILPTRRRRAKAELATKISALRTDLTTTLGDQFRREAAGSLARIRETIAPYTRFVRSEQEVLEARELALGELRDRIARLRSDIEAVTGSG
jgi:small GTP-binding protein